MNDEHIKEIVRKMTQIVFEDELNGDLQRDSAFSTPEMFGAKGDGVTDDYEAVSQAMAHAAETRKPVLLTKSYYLGSQLTIPKTLLIEGSVIAPSSQSNIKPKSWNLKSAYPIVMQSHTTLRNVGLLETTLKITGSRNQVEDCVFSICDTAMNWHNTNVKYDANENPYTAWTGEVYVRGCYFYDCIVGVLNDSEVEGSAAIIDSEISGCTVVNDRKLAETDPIQNDVFLSGRFNAVRLMDNHIYSSKVIANGDTLKDLAISNNYFDSPFTYFDATIDGKVCFTNNTFFSNGFEPNWDKASTHYVNAFEKVTGGLRKWLVFTGNTYIPPVLSTEDGNAMDTYYVFAHIKGANKPMAMQYLNNNCQFNTPFDGEDDRQIRYTLADVGNYTMTYNSKSISVKRSTNGLAMNGYFDMPPTYGSSADVYGTHTIPTPASYTTRIYATLEYSYDSENTNLKKLAAVCVKILNTGAIVIDKAPSDYVSGGRVFVNSVLADFQMNTNDAQI